MNYANKRNDERTPFKVVCSRGGKETFGLSVLAFNHSHALTLAKRMMEGSGYSVYSIPTK